MPVGQGEKSITDVPMITAKRNLAIIIDVRDHSLGTDIQIQLTDVKKTELEAVFVILDGIIERKEGHMAKTIGETTSFPIFLV